MTPTSVSKILTLLLGWTTFSHALSIGVRKLNLSYKYVYTYGNPNWTGGPGGLVCHAYIEVVFVPPRVRYESGYCIHGNGTPGKVTTGSHVGIYIKNLAPVNIKGHHGFEIGIDQPGFTSVETYPPTNVPAMNPRMDIYANGNNVPQGVCSYRQGAISFSQQDGSVLQPYQHCNAGSAYAGSIGKWLICQVFCNNV